MSVSWDSAKYDNSLRPVCPERWWKVKEIHIILVTSCYRNDVEHRLCLALGRVVVLLQEARGEFQLLSEPSNLRELLRCQQANEKKKLEARVRGKHVLDLNRTSVCCTNKYLR